MQRACERNGRLQELRRIQILRHLPKVLLLYHLRTCTDASSSAYTHTRARTHTHTLACMRVRTYCTCANGYVSVFVCRCGHPGRNAPSCAVSWQMMLEVYSCTRDVVHTCKNIFARAYAPMKERRAHVRSFSHSLSARSRARTRARSQQSTDPGTSIDRVVGATGLAFRRI